MPEKFRKKEEREIERKRKREKVYKNPKKNEEKMFGS